MIIHRPGQKILSLSPEIEIAQPRAGAAAVDWWLSGGISAANCIAAYQPKGAASLVASYINLANSGTYDAAPGVAPTWNINNGWIFNGTSQYLNSGVTITSSSWSVFVTFSNFGDGAGYLYGAYQSPTNQFRLLDGTVGGTDYVQYYNGAQLEVAPGLTNGTLGIAGLTAYRNGVAEAGALSGWAGNAGELYIAARQFNTPAYYAACYMQAFVIYNAVITAPQVTALTTAMNAL